MPGLPEALDPRDQLRPDLAGCIRWIMLLRNERRIEPVNRANRRADAGAIIQGQQVKWP